MSSTIFTLTTLLTVVHLLPSATSSMSSLPFDPTNATISTIHSALLSNRTTPTEITNIYLSRIVALNPQINAFITLNPNLLADARALDTTFSNCPDPNHLLTTQPLFAIPTLLKDNYDAPPMSTTAGCRALNASMPTTDAPTVAALRRAGALILGKANMHELALEGLSVSSLGGQTLNPFDLTRTPGGSSGGCGAALAAGLTVLATGTDTVNSLRSPASAGGLVSCRPTRGLISRYGVVPISWTQDAVGPMGTCVEDVARLLGVMAGVGYDERDNVTALRPREVDGKDYTALVGRGSLNGVRLGLVEGFFNRTESEETTPVNEALDRMVEILKEAGATVVEVMESAYNSSRISNDLDLQRYEYREELTGYLQRPETGGRHPDSMPDLYSGSEFLVIPSQYEYVNTALVSSTSNLTYDTKQKGIQDLKLALANTFARNDLDALIYPEQANLVVKIGSPSQSGRNGICAALSGSPVVTVPAGSSLPSQEAPEGVPIGMEILGRPWSEDKLLQIASLIEQMMPGRTIPALAQQTADVQNFCALPKVTPEQKIPSEYPVGVL